MFAWGSGQIRINAQLTTLKDAKVTSQLDDKSVLELNGLLLEVLAEQTLGVKKYKLELKETFALLPGTL